MSALSGHVFRPYGAYELKATYQGNLFKGLIADAVLLFAVIGGILLYQALSSGEERQIKPAKVIIISDIPTPPTVIKIPPHIDIAQPAAARPKTGIPNPVADDEIQDLSIVIPSRDEIRDILPPSLESGEGESGLIVIEDTSNDINPGKALPFTPIEIHAEMIFEAKPDYPRLARQANSEGIVWVAVYVDENGNVVDAKIYKSSGSNAGLDEAALAAAWKCKFKPAIQNGRPTKEWVTYRFVFSLRDADL